jgi:hypothetical protein
MDLECIDSSFKEDIGKTFTLYRQEDENLEEKLKVAKVAPCCDYEELGKLFGTWEYIGKENFRFYGYYHEIEWLRRTNVLAFYFPNELQTSELFYVWPKMPGDDRWLSSTLKSRKIEFHLHDGVLNFTMEPGTNAAKFKFHIENDILSMTQLDPSTPFAPPVEDERKTWTFRRTNKEYRDFAPLKSVLP